MPGEAFDSLRQSHSNIPDDLDALVAYLESLDVIPSPLTLV